jgi:hypothetical protein
MEEDGIRGQDEDGAREGLKIQETSRRLGKRGCGAGRLTRGAGRGDPSSAVSGSGAVWREDKFCAAHMCVALTRCVVFA